MIKNIFIISVIGVLMGLNSAPSVAETVRLANGEWPPFTSERLPYGGPLSRIVSEAFALEGVNVEYGYFPWKRAYELAKTGKWDGSVGWAHNSRHLQDFRLSTPVIVVDKALFHLKSTPFDWKKIDDLSRWRVGATAGYSYGAEWDHAVKSGLLNVDEVTVDEQNIRKLLLKRIDVVAMEIDVANYLIRTTFSSAEAERITHHPLLVAQAYICLALSRQLEKTPGLLERFNRGLQRLKDSGKYDEYISGLHIGNRLGITPNQTIQPAKGK
jgi:polar amino acid transport system substrate-binding protein